MPDRELDMRGLLRTQRARREAEVEDVRRVVARRGDQRHAALWTPVAGRAADVRMHRTHVDALSPGARDDDSGDDRDHDLLDAAFEVDHSYLNARIGSTRVARWAGR